MKLPYSEGTIFFVPLRGSGYARGIVARSNKEGKVLLGYFFGPRLPSPSVTGSNDIDPTKWILRARFGDLGLINGNWPIQGQLPDWNRSQWPMPRFVRKDPLGRKNPVLVSYSDTDPNQIESEAPIIDDAGLAIDSVSGYGSIEIKLTKLLCS